MWRAYLYPDLVNHHDSGEKIYDDPEQRVKTLKQQMIQTLRTEKRR